MPRTVPILVVFLIGCHPDQKFALLVDESPAGTWTRIDEPIEPNPELNGDDPWPLVPTPIHVPGPPNDPEDPDSDEPDAPTDETGIEMLLEAVLQRNRWGDGLGRCQIQVAFRKLAPPTDPPPEDPTSETGPVHIELPDEAGRCVYTDLMPLEPTEDGESGDDEIHDEPPESADDDWFLSGDVDIGDEIYLHSWETTLVLKRQPLEHGDLRYELETCDEAHFPFEQIFDLEVPFIEDAEIPGFYVEQAIGVGHDVIVTDPVPSSTVETYFHPQGDLIAFVWDELGEAPIIDDTPLVPQRMIFARNHFDGERTPFEALACQPIHTNMDLSSEDIAHLKSNPDATTEEYYLTLQIDTVYTAPAFEAPWGQTVLAKSTVSESGEVHLYSAE